MGDKLGPGGICQILILRGETVSPKRVTTKNIRIADYSNYSSFITESEFGWLSQMSPYSQKFM